MSRAEAASAVELVRTISQGRTLVMVEHDMGVVFDLADRISVLVYGEIIATDVPERIRENPAVQTAYLGTAVDVLSRGPARVLRQESHLAGNLVSRCERRDREPARA